MNQLIGALTTAFSLSLGLVQQEGLEGEPFRDIVRKSALYAGWGDADYSAVYTTIHPAPED